MADNLPRLHVICYDIANPKRLARVHRHLVKLAWPIQYSVFLAYGSPRMMRRILAELRSIIAPGWDDVRCYPLPTRADVLQLGRRRLGKGVSFNVDRSKPTGRIASNRL